MHETYLETAFELAAEALRAGRPVHVRVEGHSMHPALQPGDVLNLVPVQPEDLQTGDLVSFWRDGRSLTHRLVVRHQGRLITRGDGLCQCDTPLAVDSVLGRAAAVIRGDRVYNLQSAGWLRTNRVLGTLSRWECKTLRWLRRAGWRRTYRISPLFWLRRFLTWAAMR